MRLATGAGITVALLGCAVLAAWSFDLPLLKSLDPDWATMKANTALSFLLAGSALWLLNPVEPAPARRLAARLGAVALATIALLTIAAYAFDYDLGIDQLLFADRATPASLHPGRPAPTTAGFFLFIAIALLLLRTSRTRVGVLVDLMAGVVVAGAYLAIIGYLYHAPALYSVPGYGSMALHTAIGHLLLGAGVFLAQPDRGLMRLIRSPRAAGATARRLLPVAILAPVLLGYLVPQAVKLDLLAPTAAELLLVVAFITIFAATILWSVARVDKIDAERQRLELAGRLGDEQAKADKRFRSLLESAPDATIVADPQGRIILVNGQGEQLFGYARAEMVGQPVEMLLPERLRADHIGPRLAFHRAPQVRAMGSGRDLTGRRKDGTEFPVEVSLSPVETDDGMLVSAAIRDSSARRQREAELVGARAAAEAATRRIQTLIEATPLAIVELDRNECVRSWNPAAEKMFGWRAEELIGCKLPNIPEDRQGELGLLVAASATAAPLQAFETRRRRKDGSMIDVSVWTAPRRDGSGAIDGMIGIAADMTEQKRMEEHLRQSQRLKAVGQLTGGIAHEFNNLLQTILGNLDLLRDSLHGQRDAVEIVERVIRAGTRGAELTHQLLAFSRRQPLRPEPFNPKDELRGLENLVRATIGAQYTIRVDVPAEISRALADTTQLDNAILNLVINSRDAMPDGGTIIIRADNVMLENHRARDLEVAPGCYVAIEVTDTGTGMSPEVLAHAAEPFFTTKDIGKGTGLGLSMVHGFVKQSGGAMEIVSAFGKGTTVRLLLPTTTEIADQQAAVKPRPRLVGVRNVTVLVVEDEPDVLGTAAAMLRSLGYGVIEAADGPAALAALQAGPVDVLFTDVILPKGMSGRDLARVAQAHQPELKVIYTSGYNENVIVHDGVLDEGVTLVRKPYSKEDLLVAIDKATLNIAEAATRQLA
jgi:PAS domain S-box-containing protein